jgi:hypothetical protein
MLMILVFGKAISLGEIRTKKKARALGRDRGQKSETRSQQWNRVPKSVIWFAGL